MKALVLCGGLPQIAMMKELKSRGVTVVLADMNEKVAGRAYCDIFYPVSTLDVEGIKNVAITEKVDFLIAVCADQVLQVVAEVSEALGLPCYIDFETAVNVSKKSYMKKIFVENGVPTSKHVILAQLEPEKISHLRYPLIVKPVDAYSSRGVQRVDSYEELIPAFAEAVKISRTDTAVVEEFVVGDELTVDVYVEEGKAHVLCISNLYKIGEDGRFVIYRAMYPAAITKQIEEQIADAAQKIATAFGLVNSPMLIQLICDGERISVIEFCARTGGVVKFMLIKRVTGFDVVKAVADLTMGKKPHVEPMTKPRPYMISEFLYCKAGVLDHIEGAQELYDAGVLSEYSQLKNPGVEFTEIRSSGDRVACFMIQADDMETLRKNHKLACEKIKVISTTGEDILRHDLLENFHN